MPNRRHYRGPRRPAAGGAEGAPGESAPPPAPRAEGEAGPPGEGARRRRRRGRGGRGTEASAATEALPLLPQGERAGEREPLPGAEAGPAGDAARRKRRRRGRGRRGEGRPDEPGQVELTEEGLPTDYIPLAVERGMPVLYEPRALEPEEPPKPQKSKRVNSGKLFWYIRSKSYVPIPELRRRFEITPDEMATIQDDGHKLYVGLPQDVADVVSNLRRQQKIGIDCSVDFSTPVVIGVYPLNH